MWLRPCVHLTRQAPLTESGSPASQQKANKFWEPAMARQGACILIIRGGDAQVKSPAYRPSRRTIGIGQQSLLDQYFHMIPTLVLSLCIGLPPAAEPPPRLDFATGTLEGW